MAILLSFYNFAKGVTHLYDIHDEEQPIPANSIPRSRKLCTRTKYHSFAQHYFRLSNMLVYMRSFMR